MKPYPKLAHRFAIAAALLAGTGSVVLSAPALAKKDDKADQSAGLKYSPDVLKLAQTAQPLLQANNVAAAEPAVAAVEAAAKTDDDKYIAARFRLQLEVARYRAAGQSGDQSKLKAPLDALLANPKTPAADKATYAYQLGELSFGARQNADAVRYLEQARQLGYSDPNMGLQIVRAKYDMGDVAGGNAAVDAVIKSDEAAGRKSDEALYRLALQQSYNKHDKAASMQWLQRWVTAFPTAKNWHDVLTIYGLQQNSVATLDRGQTVDLYRLMRQTKSLDTYSYEDYADKTIRIGLPDEAKTVVAEGRATGKLPANANTNALAADAAKGAAAEGSLTSLETRAKAAPTGSLASQTADAYLGQGNYAKAIPLYQVALSKGGVKADEVNLHLGIAMALSGDKAAAKTAFGAVTAAPAADIAQFWVIALDHPATA